METFEIIDVSSNVPSSAHTYKHRCGSEIGFSGRKNFSPVNSEKIFASRTQFVSETSFIFLPKEKQRSLVAQGFALYTALYTLTTVLINDSSRKNKRI